MRNRTNKKDSALQIPVQAKAVVFTGPKKSFRIESYPVLTPKKSMALLKMLRSGICGTDIHIHEGRLALPFKKLIIGHELIGKIMDMGTGPRRDGLGVPLRKNDLAIACVAIPCGKCLNCRAGETASCLQFGVTYFQNPDEPPHFFGGHAEVLHSPTKNLVKIPRNMDLDAVAAFPCAGPTAIRAFTYAGGLKRGELVVVQGTGPVGLFAIAWAAKAGCRVIAIGSVSDPDRVKLARQLGAEKVLDYRLEKAEDRIKKINALAKNMNRGNGADVVFEASGSPAAIPEGINLVRTRGRYIVPGQYSDSGPVSIAPHLITFKAIQITGSGQYQIEDVGTYLSFLSRHADVRRAFAKCVTHHYRIDQANLAFKNASAGKSVKGVFASYEK